jgi:hypothetical protein
VDNFLQATYADPNAIETEVIACTVRQSRPNRVGHLEGGRVGDVEQQVVGVQLMSMDGTGRPRERDCLAVQRRRCRRACSGLRLPFKTHPQEAGD